MNSGTATLDLTGFSVTRPFAISANKCGITLAFGKSCRVSIFTPTETGTATGMLSVSDNAPGSRQTVSLSQHGRLAGRLAEPFLLGP